MCVFRKGGKVRGVKVVVTVEGGGEDNYDLG